MCGLFNQMHYVYNMRRPGFAVHYMSQVAHVSLKYRREVQLKARLGCIYESLLINLELNLINQSSSNN